MQRVLHTPLSLLLLFLVVASSAAPLEWQRTNPAATADDLTDIAFGNGLYVAIGSTTAIIASPDLATWDVQEVPYVERGAPNDWSLAYGPEAGFVATSYSSQTLVSKDGKHWQNHYQPENAYRVGVTYGNGLYMAGPRSQDDVGVVAVSKDGVQWSYYTVNNQVGLAGVSFVNGRFLAFGRDGLRTGGIYSSVNGHNWSLFSNISTTVPGPIATIFSVQAGAGSTLVALVGFYDSVTLVTSDDLGQTWKPTLTSAGYAPSGPLHYGNGVFFASIWNATNNQVNYVWASFDQGQTWQPATNTLAPNAIPKLANGRFVAVGPSGRIQTSTDGGRTFIDAVEEGILDPFASFINTPPGYRLNGNSVFLQIQNPNNATDQSIIGSADGAQWTRVTVFKKPILRMEFVESEQVWVGNFVDGLAVSKDLVNWSDLPSPYTPAHPNIGRNTLESFAYVAGTWVVLINTFSKWSEQTGSALYISTGSPTAPSSQWTLVHQGSVYGKQVVAANGALLFVPSSGPLLYSLTRGQTWVALANVPPAFVNPALVYGLGKHFVLVSSDQSSIALSTSPVVDGWASFTFADSPEAQVQSAFLLGEDPNNRKVAVSLNDGSIRTFDPSASAWSVWSVIPQNYNGVDGVRTTAKGGYVAINLKNLEIYTAAV